MHSKYKSAFTLAEIVCAIAIVGILATTIAVTLMKSTNKAIKYQYINAYTSLSKAYYNGLISGYNPFSSQNVDGLAPVHSDAKDTGALQLCRGLTTFINTKDAKRGVSQGKSYDYSASCSADKLTSELANEFKEDNIQFISSNGMKFYISKQLGDETIKFYLVFVDINGSAKPNSFEYQYYSNGNIKKEPDIHAFAILQSGRVIPIGAAEFDSSFLTARVAYFDDDGDTHYTKISRAYYEAKGEAWGYYSDIPFEEAKDVFDESELYSMNDLIRSKINSSSKIITGLPDFTTLTPRDVLNNSTNHCVARDLESCYIIPDEYRAY